MQRALKYLTVFFILNAISVLGFLIFVVNSGNPIPRQNTPLYLKWAVPSYLRLLEKYKSTEPVILKERELSKTLVACRSPSYVRLGTSGKVMLDENQGILDISKANFIPLGQSVWRIKASGIQSANCSDDFETQWKNIRPYILSQPFLMEIDLKNSSQEKFVKKLMTGPCNGISAIFLNHDLKEIRKSRIDSSLPITLNFNPGEVQTLGLLLESYDSRTPGCVWPNWMFLSDLNSEPRPEFLVEQRYYTTVEHTAIYFFFIGLLFFIVGYFRWEAEPGYLLGSLAILSFGGYSALGLHSSQDLSFSSLMPMRLIVFAGFFISMTLGLRFLVSSILPRFRNKLWVIDVCSVLALTAFFFVYFGASVHGVDENRYLVRSMISFLKVIAIVYFALILFLASRMRGTEYAKTFGLMTSLVGAFAFSLVLSTILNAHYFSNQTPFMYSESVRVMMILVTLSLVLFERFREVEVIKLSRKLRELSEQVAHDIRSPLSALEMIIPTVRASEENLLLLKSVAERIRLIVKTLSPHTSLINSQSNAKSEELEVRETVLLYELILDSILEKRLLLKDLPAIQIKEDCDVSNRLCFVELNATEMKRILSNLLNNAVEAIDARAGTVVISIRIAKERELEITIQDSGKGMAPEVLDKLGQRGASFGKAGGSGLGLYHAIERLRGWGGELKIKSNLGEGTCISIRLSATNAPSWFWNPMISDQKTILVSISDFGGFTHRFSRLNEFKSYYSKNFSDLDSVVFVFDSKLDAGSLTLAELISELGLIEQAVVIVSRLHSEEAASYRALGIKVTRLLGLDASV